MNTETSGMLIAGKYEIESKIGRGGVGVVYQGRHRGTGRKVAIKLLNQEHSNKEESRSRFLQEARAAARFNHPNVVDILDVGEEPDGTVYQVLKYLEGKPLSAVIEEQGKLTIGQVLNYLLPVMHALVVAHKKGIIHRDLKPENIFISYDDTNAIVPKLLDFGIAKVLESAEVKTKTGAAMGTLQYMSPEQLTDSSRVGPASDVWSMGAVIYECLSGKRPFEAELEPGIVVAISMGQHKPLNDVVRDLPPNIPAAVERALVVDLDKRFKSMQELIDALVVEAERAGIPVRAGNISAASMETVVDPEQNVSTNEIHPPKPHVENRDERAKTQSKTSARQTRWSIVGVLCVLIIGLWFWFGRDQQASPKPVRPPVERPDTLKKAAAVEHDMRKAVAPIPDEPPIPEGMVTISGGRFEMGSREDEWREAMSWCIEDLSKADCPDSLFRRESPSRPVSVASFLIDRTEVTNAALARWLADLPDRTIRRNADGVQIVYQADLPIVALYNKVHAPVSGLVGDDSGENLTVRPKMEDLPVIYVTWYGASRFCESRGLRLPTEKQWEYAARGQERRAFPWGETRPGCKDSVFARVDGLACSGSARKPSKVGSTLRDRTPEGVFDLGGNAAEWVDTVYVDDKPNERAPFKCVAPKEERSIDTRSKTCQIYKGGDWVSIAERTRSASRSRAPQDMFFDSLGFRCVR
jgi:serine/threonine protein kinase